MMKINWDKCRYTIKSFLLQQILLGLLILISIKIAVDFARKGYAPEVTFLIIFILYLPLCCILAVYFSSFLSRYILKLSVTQRMLVASFCLLDLSLEVLNYESSLVLVTEAISVISIIFVVMSHFKQEELKENKTFSAVLFVYFSILAYVSLSSYYYQYSWMLFDTTDTQKKQIDNITYISKNNEDLKVIAKAHHLLSEEYKAIPCRVVLDSEIFDLLPQSVEVATPFDLKKPLIFIKNDIFEDNNDQLAHKRALPILVHELTHARQKIKYQSKTIVMPKWKLEGHATMFQRNPISLPYFINMENPTYSFTYLFFRSEDYVPAFAQAWYYLEYLEMSEDEFFSDSTNLAPWGKVSEAWFERHPKSKKLFELLEEQKLRRKNSVRKAD